MESVENGLGAVFHPSHSPWKAPPAPLRFAPPSPLGPSHTSHRPDDEGGPKGDTSKESKVGTLLTSLDSC